MNPILKYFNAERVECLIGIGLGFASLFLGIYFWLRPDAFHNGMAYPFLAACVIQFIVCTIVVRRTPKDIHRVLGYMQSDKSKITSIEIPRMEVVLKGFVTYRYTEIALLGIGFIGFVVAKFGSSWRGAAIGIMIQATLILFFDYFAEKRGKNYLDYLKTQIK
jgi:hypothetical protein